MTEKILRGIKSFVRRKGRLSEARSNALDTLLPRYQLSTQQGLINLDTLFTEQGELVIEIGFGMGDALIEMALRSPEKRFIGIEVHAPGVANVLVNIDKHSLNNIRIFQEDAIEVLKTSIPTDSIDRVLLFFPDPWPKTKQKKRRIVQADFVKLIAEKLKPRGVFHLATDWEDYAKQMLQVIEASQLFENQFPESGYAPRPDSRPLTKFEKRGQALGYGIWDLIFYGG